MCCGRVIYNEGKKTLSKSAIIDAIVGDANAYQAPSNSRSLISGAMGKPWLSVTNLQTDRLKGINLEAYRGEILGIYGLAGAGRTRLCQTLFGLETVTGGDIRLGHKEYHPSSPAKAIDKGIAYLTEERKKDGFIPQMSSYANAMLPVLKKFRSGGFVSHSAARQAAAELLSKMNTLGTLSGPIKSLSGGNQQKVLLARVIAQNANLVLLDEPTKGVDIGAKADIYRIIHQLADKGCCVIVVSSEEEELLDVADTITVFRQGKCDGVIIPARDLKPADLRKAAWEHAEAQA